MREVWEPSSPRVRLDGAHASPAAGGPDGRRPDPVDRGHALLLTVMLCAYTGRGYPSTESVPYPWGVQQPLSSGADVLVATWSVHVTPRCAGGVVKRRLVGLDSRRRRPQGG